MINIRNQFQDEISKKMKRLRTLEERLNVSGGLDQASLSNIRRKVGQLKREINESQDLAREVL